MTRFEIDGEAYGGTFDAQRDGRPEVFFRQFPEAKRILELGSQEGGHTFALASHPGVREVVGIEGRSASFERARFVRRCLGLRNVDLHLANLEVAQLAPFGRFDAVFCSGVLYHLPNPWRLLEQIGSVTSGLYLWTHYAAENRVDTEANGYRGMTWKEGGLADPLSGLSPTSFWPIRDDLLRMIREHALPRVEILDDQPQCVNGPAVLLVARAS